MKLALPRFKRAATAFGHDVIMAAISFVLAVGLRIGDLGVFLTNESLMLALASFTGGAAVVFWSVGLYRGVWRYASLNDVTAIIKAVTLAILVFAGVTFLFTRLEAVPRSALLINWFVLVILLSAPRMLYRVIKDHGLRHILEQTQSKRVPVVVIGVDDAAELFIREMARDPAAGYEVLGLVDTRGESAGQEIRGVPVLGTLDQLPRLLDQVGARERAPQRLILSQRLERAAMAELLDFAHSRGMTIARLPRVTDFQSSESGESVEVRPIAVEDLLGRTQAALDRGAMRDLIVDRRVLITGAGGSIGSELARQIAALGPSHLSLLDNTEHNLYAIDLEISELFSELPRSALLADVRDRRRVDLALASEQPDLVFHAAALKHVPLVESNPLEGLHTNVCGTRNVADACLDAGVHAMVLISTDKAINPANVMGASKRLAESYCQALDLTERRRHRQGERAATRFVTLRFGNVLGSTGSVVPLFQRQLARGGPLTVTHPEVTRYFMMTREAVELVLQGAALSIDKPVDDAGKIYVLDMGAPVKIADLARQMIRLAGLRPDVDVEVVFTGLRPGEKISEELFHDQEPMLQTPHPGLLLAAPRTVNLELLSRGLDELGDKIALRDETAALGLLKRLVPDYRADSMTEGLQPLRSIGGDSGGNPGAS